MKEIRMEDVEAYFDQVEALRAERDVLRQTVEAVARWAHAEQGGIKTPAEVWPAMSDLLASALDYRPTARRPDS